MLADWDSDADWFSEALKKRDIKLYIPSEARKLQLLAVAVAVTAVSGFHRQGSRASICRLG